MISSCATPPKPVFIYVPPSVTVEGKAAERPPGRIVSTGRTFWQAMSGLDPAFAERHPVTDAQRSFAHALTLVMAGRIDEAELQLDSLRANTADSLVRSASRVLLTAMLQHQDKWKILSELNPAFPRDTASRDTASRDDDRANVESWAAAFKDVARREVSFPSQSVVLPLSLSASGAPMVAVTINGKQRTFWLDTGSSMSIVASDVAAECGVVELIRDTLEVVTATGRVPARPAAIRRLELGRIAIANATAMIVDSDLMMLRVEGMDQAPPIKIEGVIGFDIISRLNVSIDYGNGRVTLAKPDTIERGRRRERNLFWVGTPVVRLVTTKGVPLHFNLDTGAQETYSTDALVEKMKVPTFVAERRLISGLAGLQTVRGRFIDHIRLALGGRALVFRKLLVVAPAYATFVTLDGILGSDIGKSGIVRIDATNGIFLIEGHFPSRALRIKS